MSGNTTTKAVPRNKIEVKEKGKIIISPNFKKKVDYLHSKYPGKEWSGPLIYNVKEGEIEHPGTLVIEVLDIIPMDLGNGAYTEYDLPEALKIDVFAEAYEAAMDSGYRIGHCHSHHHMGTFFSGTDDSELVDNVDNYTNYLSLIVGYKTVGDMTAKLAYVTKHTTSYTFKGFNNKEQTLTSVEKESIIFIPFDIECEPTVFDIVATSPHFSKGVDILGLTEPVEGFDNLLKEMESLGKPVRYQHHHQNMNTQSQSRSIGTRSTVTDYKKKDFSEQRNAGKTAAEMAKTVPGTQFILSRIIACSVFNDKNLKHSLAYILSNLESVVTEKTFTDSFEDTFVNNFPKYASFIFEKDIAEDELEDIAEDCIQLLDSYKQSFPNSVSELTTVLTTNF